MPPHLSVNPRTVAVLLWWVFLLFLLSLRCSSGPHWFQTHVREVRPGDLVVPFAHIRIDKYRSTHGYYALNSGGRSFDKWGPLSVQHWSVLTEVNGLGHVYIQQQQQQRRSLDHSTLFLRCKCMSLILYLPVETIRGHSLVHKLPPPSKLYRAVELQRQ